MTHRGDAPTGGGWGARHRGGAATRARARRAGRGVCAGARTGAPRARPGPRGGRLDACCRPRHGAGSPASARGACRRGPWSARGSRWRRWRGDLPAGLCVRPRPPSPGLAGVGACRGVLWPGHALRPGGGPADAGRPWGGGRRPSSHPGAGAGTDVPLGRLPPGDDAGRVVTGGRPARRPSLPRTRSATTTPTHPGRTPTDRVPRTPGAAAPGGLCSSPLARRRAPGPARQPQRQPAHGPPAAAGHLPPGVPARRGP